MMELCFLLGDDDMFQIGDYVVYKRDVCKVHNIKKNHYQGKDYYVLHPVDDDSLTIDVPMENKCGLLRSVISKKEAEEFVRKIPEIPIISVQERAIENEYKNLMRSNDIVDLIKIIKTSYLRNDSRRENGKRLSEIDENYLKRAEQILYNELSISLGMPFDDVKKYIIKTIIELTNVA